MTRVAHGEARALSLLDGLLAHICAAKTRFGLLNNQHDSVVEALDAVAAFQREHGGAERFNFAIVM